MDNDEPAETSKWMKKKAPTAVSQVTFMKELIHHLKFAQDLAASTALSNTQASIISVDSLDARPLQGKRALAFIQSIH